MVPCSVYVILFHRIELTCLQVFQIHIFRPGTTPLLLLRSKGRCDYVQRLFYMKRPLTAVPDSVIVIDSVCNIAGLLGFQNQGSPFYGVDAARINLKKIPLLYRNLPYKASQRFSRIIRAASSRLLAWCPMTMVVPGSQSSTYQHSVFPRDPLSCTPA